MDELHEQSKFVVCRACHNYFHECEIVDHQRGYHADFQWESSSTAYYLNNNEVTFYLNRLHEIREMMNKLRLLVF